MEAHETKATLEDRYHKDTFLSKGMEAVSVMMRDDMATVVVPGAIYIIPSDDVEEIDRIAKHHGFRKV